MSSYQSTEKNGVSLVLFRRTNLLNRLSFFCVKDCRSRLLKSYIKSRAARQDILEFNHFQAFTLQIHRNFVSHENKNTVVGARKQQSIKPFDSQTKSVQQDCQHFSLKRADKRADRGPQRLLLSTSDQDRPLFGLAGPILRSCVGMRPRNLFAVIVPDFTLDFLGFFPREKSGKRGENPVPPEKTR